MCRIDKCLRKDVFAMKDARTETLKLVLGETERILKRELNWRRKIFQELVKSNERINSAIHDIEYLKSVVTRIENDEE